MIGGVILIRGYFAKAKDEQIARRTISQREKHERAAAHRHDALMETLAKLAGRTNAHDSRGGTEPKKSQASGVRPR